MNVEYLHGPGPDLERGSIILFTTNLHRIPVFLVSIYLISTVQRIGFDVSIHTTGSSGSRWFDVDKLPSRDVSQSVKRFNQQHCKKKSRDRE